MENPRLAGLTARISSLAPARPIGRVAAIDGGTIRVAGLSHEVAIGDQLRLERRGGGWLHGEVLNLLQEHLIMMPDAAPEGVRTGDHVVAMGPAVLAPCTSWVGRIVDPMGLPLDGRPLLPGAKPMPHRAAAPDPARRRGLGPRIQTSVAIFDTMLPLVRGQRIGLFAGSGVGKSRLLSRFARSCQADVVVLALIGERGRELGDFVHHVLGPDGMRRSVVVAATSDRSALARRRCAFSAMTIAEYFRDQGAQVLLLADSITRFAEAHREVAIASGELPALRGFPASMAHQIMSLCERAGPGVEGTGDITAVLSVLVAGSDMEEPIADIMRGVLDGHVVLDRKIAERGRFPAVDLLRSVSRSLPEAATEGENDVIGQVRRLLGAYAQSETMVRAGLYREGTDPLLDQAIRALPDLEAFFGDQQDRDTADGFSRLSLILRRSASGSKRMPPRPDTG